MNNTKQNIILFTVILFILILAGCSGRLFTVHKIDVQQGNAIDAEKVDQLRIGMTKEQVDFLMGTPLLEDPFHPDRWDYVYFLIPDYGDSVRHHVSIFFDGNVVSHFEKSDIPSIQPDSDTSEEQQ